MIRKILYGVALAGVLLVGELAAAQPNATPPQAKQEQQSRSVSGKVTNIGSDRTSFALEVTDNGAKHTMQFVVDGNTQVQGRVAVGTDAVVKYQSTSDGRLLALSVGPTNGPSTPSGN